MDHTFTYERSDVTFSEGRVRLRLVVSGDKLTAVTYFLKIPEAFTRRYASMRSANELIGLGWVKFRASRTLECHLGGTPQVIGGQDVLLGSEQNRSIVQMYLGEQAPIPASKNDPFGPGCKIQ